MTQAQHTPGPWRYKGQSHDGLTSTIYLGNSDILVDINGMDNKANAHLIAAAPELYQELDKLASLKPSGISFDYRYELEQAIARAKLLTTKARGEV